MIKNTPKIKPIKFCFLFSILIVFFAINIAGCKPKQKSEPPEKLAESYLNYVKNGQSEKAIELYSDKMFSVFPKANWLKSLSVYHEYFGNLKSYELQHTKKVQNKSKEYSGIYTYLIYKVEYDKKENQEVFTIRQPIGGGASELAGHYMNVDVVEPEKLLERIFKEQAGETVTEEKPEKPEKPVPEKTIVKTTSLENISQQSSKEKDTAPEKEKISE